MCEGTLPDHISRFEEVTVVISEESLGFDGGNALDISRDGHLDLNEFEGFDTAGTGVVIEEMEVVLEVRRTRGREGHQNIMGDRWTYMLLFWQEWHVGVADF